MKDLRFKIEAVQNSSVPYRVLFWSTAISLCALFILAGFSSFDPPGIDSNGFAPAAISYKHGDGLVNPIYQRAFDVDAGARFVYHGPLYPLALAWLMPRADASSAILVTRLYNAIGFLLASLFLYFVAFREESSFWTWLVAWTALFALATVMWTDLRPESLSSMFISSGILILYLVKSLPLRCILVGLCLGLIAITQPTIFLIANSLLLIYWAWLCDLRRILTNYSIVVITAVGVCVIFFALFYPFSFTEWLTGMWIHALMVNGHIDLSLIIPKLILTPITPGAGLVLAYGLLAGGIYVFNHKADIANIPMFAVGAVSLMFLLCFFALSTASHSYVLSGVWPLVIAGIVYFTTEGRRWSVIVSLLLVGVLSLGILRQAVEFRLYAKNGMSLADARNRFAAFASNHRGVYATSDAMWALSENYGQMIHAVVGPNDDTLHKRPDFFVMQQYHRATLTPPDIAGWELVENNFISTAPSVLRVRIGNTPPGYQYAIYKRKTD